MNEHEHFDALDVVSFCFLDLVDPLRHCWVVNFLGRLLLGIAYLSMKFLWMLR